MTPEPAEPTEPAPPDRTAGEIPSASAPSTPAIPTPMPTPASPPPPSPPPSPTPPKKGLPAWAISLLVLFAIFFFICLCGIGVAIPYILTSKAALTQTTAVAHLKTTAEAQARYLKLTNSYASSAALLLKQNLIDTPLAAAFQQHQANTDTRIPVPLDGYRYRMLLGEGTAPASYVMATSTTGEQLLSSWAATARPEGATSATDVQLYITEAGIVWRAPDPQTGQFLLDAAPAAGQNTQWSAVK